MKTKQKQCIVDETSLALELLDFTGGVEPSPMDATKFWKDRHPEVFNKQIQGRVETMALSFLVNP